MVDGDVFRMSEAADTADSAPARVARKQTNNVRAAEELAKSAAMLTLPSKMLPMLRLLNKNAGCCCGGGCHRNQTKVVLASDDDTAIS